jgi:glutamyl-tRNA reductase
MKLENFYIAGINYKKTDAEVRGMFAINSTQYKSLLKTAGDYDMQEFFVLSTCNRTEIYGIASSADDLVDLLCTETVGTKEQFLQSAYIKKGEEAIDHLFNVAAGLDSQILGDYEIVGQLKTAIKFAKENGFVGAFTDRLFNEALKASKQIKNTTELSGGTVSVAFAAVQYIRNHVPDVAAKSILLLGTGKIGRNTCKNLVDYLETKNITLINRSPEKAQELANELCLRHASINELETEVRKADIILVATNSPEPVILKSHVEGKAEKLIIDLSIPYNVETAAQELENVKAVNVDELSRLKDETLRKRQAEVPRAKAIIGEHMTEFADWNKMRQHVPVLKAVKSKLKEIHTSPLFIPLYNPANSSVNTDVRIQRVINGMASKMRASNQKGCQYIEAINEFIATGTN